MQNETDIPVYKVGAVVFRQRKGEGHTSSGDREEHDVLEALIVRPKPKREGELPNFVLPRGSRQYEARDADQQPIWHDVRDDETARSVANRMEPLHETLLREMKEEAGIPTLSLVRQKEVYELGERVYHSPNSGKSYPVQWYVIWPDDKTLSSMASAVPEDATEARWCSMEELEALQEQGLLSKGYLDVVAEAAHKAYYGFKDHDKVDLQALRHAEERQRG